jgi:hypothetical protein
MLTIRPTMAADCEAFLPGPPPYRIQALTAVEDDGTVVAIGGLMYLPDGAVSAFLEMSEEACRKYPVSLYKGARQILGLAKDKGYRKVLTRADVKREAACRFLERLGFEPVGFMKDERVYLWQPLQQSPGLLAPGSASSARLPPPTLRNSKPRKSASLPQPMPCKKKGARSKNARRRNGRHWNGGG